jgi:hypothetical protein
MGDKTKLKSVVNQNGAVAEVHDFCVRREAPSGR